METAGEDEAHASRLKSDAHERKMKTRMKLMMRRMSNMGGSRFLSYKGNDDDEEDNNVIARFRSRWEDLYTANGFGSFESTTVVPPMLYTFGSIPKYAGKECTLPIFSIKVARLKEEGLHWPLHVYGLIAIRDSVDPRRNLLFHRTRDNCQTITEGDPYLQLAGPSRAVVLLDPVTFEVQLTARGRTESEDKVLCFGIVYTQHPSGYLERTQIFTARLRCKQSELEIGFTVLSQSVEATIRVEIVEGSWPEHLKGLLTASRAGIDHECIVLVDSRDGRMPINGSGVIQLSRQVVSAELTGELKVDVVAYHVDDDNFYSDVAKGSVLFTPKEAAISYETCSLGFCKIGVTVGWSLFAFVEELPWGRTTPSSKGA